MRTYEDVKAALNRYKEELAKEAGSRNRHRVITGGGMCITRKGGSTQYFLGKGDPVPMKKDTANSNLAKFQERCGENIKLEMMDYTVWLNASINECNNLIACLQRSMSGTDDDQPDRPQEIVSVPVPVKDAPVHPGVTLRTISISCAECPYGINTCWCCRFAKGVDTSTMPWTVICMAPEGTTRPTE